MAQQRPTITFEDIPLDQARTMGRGPRMDPELYHQLRERMQSLSDQAVCMTLPDGTNPTTMQNRIIRVAAELNIPVTIRRVTGSLLFWKSTHEDLQQATEVAQRLHRARGRRKTRPGRRRRA